MGEKGARRLRVALHSCAHNCARCTLTHEKQHNKQQQGAENGTARLTVPFNRAPVCSTATSDAAAASDAACLWLSASNATFPASSVMANALGWSDPEAGELT